MDAFPILFPAVTNRESWEQLIGLDDADTGDPIDLSQITGATLEIRRAQPHIDDTGYASNYDYGVANDYGPVISLSLGNGLTVADLGQMQVSVSLAQMRTLDADVYSIAMTITNGTDSRQLFIGRLPVLFGGVT